MILREGICACAVYSAVVLEHWYDFVGTAVVGPIIDQDRVAAQSFFVDPTSNLCWQAQERRARLVGDPSSNVRTVRSGAHSLDLQLHLLGLVRQSITQEVSTRSNCLVGMVLLRDIRLSCFCGLEAVL